MSAEKPSAGGVEEKKHYHWDKLVSAAYLRIMGLTQAQAAGQVGRSERTVREWESLPIWEDARNEARGRWLSDVEDASRRAVLNSVRAGNAAMGLTLLERLDQDLAPPKQRVEASGPNGGPIEYRDLSDEDLKAKAARLHNRVAGMFPSTAGKP